MEVIQFIKSSIVLFLLQNIVIVIPSNFHTIL